MEGSGCRPLRGFLIAFFQNLSGMTTSLIHSFDLLTIRKKSRLLDIQFAHMNPLYRFALIIVWVGSTLTAVAQSPPNIVFILADDLGYGDLSCYGHRDIKTPNIDRLAQQGLLLTDFYAPSPLCSPARAGFLTGRTPFRTGIKSWIPEDQDIFLHREEITIAALLKANGYQTFLGGKWHLNGGLGNPQQPQPEEHGFDHWLAAHAFALPHHKNLNNYYRNGEALGEVDGFAGQLATNEAIQWLDGRDRNKPFFLYMAYLEVHSEIASPDSFNTMYSNFTKSEIDLENLADRGPGEYYANVTHLDYQVGQLMQKLEEEGLVDNTIVIFTSDNGPVTTQWRYWWEVNLYGSTGGLRGRKADLFEGGIRVPCIIRYPGKVVAGSTSNVPLHGYDLLPTICAITGIETPADRVLDGIDFSPIFNGKDLVREQPLFWGFETRPFDDPEGFSYAVRDDEWKLITDKGLERTLLYNLKDDPYEVRDLTDQQSELVAKLKGQVKKIITSIEEDRLRPR
ncbi:MAG: sulfatase family protein [Cyclobacteriaceae bacterium]